MAQSPTTESTTNSDPIYLPEDKSTFLSRNKHIILITLLALALIGSWIFFWWWYKKSSGGVGQVTGTIDSILGECKGGNGTEGTITGPLVQCGAIVKYDVSGKTYKERVQLDTNKYHNGDIIQVFYMKDEPSVFYVRSE